MKLEMEKNIYKENPLSANVYFEEMLRSMLWIKSLMISL